MNKLLVPMLKEEWRAHSAFFGSFMFALFPLMILAASFIGTVFASDILKAIPASDILLMLCYLYVMIGTSAGSFGLLGREAMNRRFGQASLLAYSSRTLPISEKEIFLSFIIKEFCYYIVYWILPLPLGFALGSLASHMPVSFAYFLLVSFTVSFLIGLSLSFVLSTIFVHTSKRFFSVIVFLLLAAFILFNRYLDLIPTYRFLIAKDHGALILPILASVFFSGISILFLKLDFPVDKRPWKEMLSKISMIPGLSVVSSKDLIDLWRSEGGFGKILFSMLLPSLALWKIIEIFTEKVVPANFLTMFTIAFAMLAPNIYNWLTEFDTYGNYAFLPVLPSDLIKSKFKTFIYINLLSFLVVVGVALARQDIGNLASSLLCITGLSIWSASVIVYLTGLSPNVLLYSPKIFILYILFHLPVTVGFLVLSVFNTQYMAFCVFMVIPALFLLKKSFSKWDNAEQVAY
ncbi:MAG: hypothetical protein HGA85_03900 [Nanoarchaeota archaeon]|nr:hypothetical protein [Nanoarchaeota archaeon]